MQTLLNFTHSYSNWVAFGVMALGMCGLGLLMPVLRRLTLRRPLPDTVMTAAMDGLKALATFMVFVLAVSLSQVMSHQRQAEELVQREATLLNQLDRGLARIGVPALAEMRPVLLDYMRSLVSEEWPAMADGGYSRRSAELLSRVQRTVRLTDIETPRQQVLYGDILRTMESLSDTRYARLQMARVSLPSLFYSVIGLGFLIMLPICFMTRGDPGSMLLQAAIIGSLSLLLTLVMIIDRPFSGESQVSPQAIERAIERNVARVP